MMYGLYANGDILLMVRDVLRIPHVLPWDIPHMLPQPHILHNMTMMLVMTQRIMNKIPIPFKFLAYVILLNVVKCIFPKKKKNSVLI